MDEKRRRFEAEVLPHMDAAYRFARWLSHSPADADDVVQEAILRAFRAFGALRGADAKAWLLTIVRNCHASAFRQQQRRALVPLPDESDARDGHALVASAADPEDESIRRDDERSLNTLLSTLPQDYREILVLREIEELSYREIATVTNMPMGTVMSRLARARAALKTQWLQQMETTACGTLKP
jgi:RNA polymerase sigma factor (sigma-70 family)